VIHLDRHYWRPGWHEPDSETWSGQVAELVAGPRWIIDGNYGRTLTIRLAAADTAVFLDFSTALCLSRALRRQLRSFGRTRCDMAPGCPERLDPAFLHYIWRYRRDYRASHLAQLEQFTGRHIVLRRPAEAADFLGGLMRAAPARCGSRPGPR
jgi:adenylate kinase family enzyme